MGFVRALAIGVAASSLNAANAANQVRDTFSMTSNKFSVSSSP